MTFLDDCHDARVASYHNMLALARVKSSRGCQVVLRSEGVQFSSSNVIMVMLILFSRSYGGYHPHATKVSFPFREAVLWSALSLTYCDE